MNGWALLDATEAPPANDIRAAGAGPSVPIRLSIKHQMEKTFQKITKAFSTTVNKGPLKEFEWRNHLDHEGRVVRTEELWARIFQGGIDPSLRREVWKHLLNVFPPDLTEDERERHLMMKVNVYWHLTMAWKAQDPNEIETITHMVMKDVLRTDRTYPYFAVPDEHPHMDSLFNVLTTYALANPDVSYAQGMSDLAAPLLVVFEDEAVTYTCFTGLMNRMKSSFLLDGKAMSKKFEHLAFLVQRTDPEFYKFLVMIGADDMFFCYRWLLLDLKREFPFDDALHLFEVTWSSLVPSASTQLPLSGTTFNSVNKTSRGSYNNLCSLNGSLTNLMSDAADCDSDDDEEEILLNCSTSETKLIQPPEPGDLADGNPFSLFMCLAILLLHKEHCIQQQMDYNALAMYFDKMVRKHDLNKTLAKARSLYGDYLSFFNVEMGDDIAAKEDTTATCFNDLVIEAPPQRHFVEC